MIDRLIVKERLISTEVVGERFPTDDNELARHGLDATQPHVIIDMAHMVEYAQSHDGPGGLYSGYDLTMLLHLNYIYLGYDNYRRLGCDTPRNLRFDSVQEFHREGREVPDGLIDALALHSLDMLKDESGLRDETPARAERRIRQFDRRVRRGTRWPAEMEAVVDARRAAGWGTEWFTFY